MLHGQNIKCSWRARAARPISPTGAGVIELLFCITTTSAHSKKGFNCPARKIMVTALLRLLIVCLHPVIWCWTWQQPYMGDGRNRPVVVKFSDISIVQSVYLGPRPYLHNVTRAQGFCLNPTVNFWCNLAVSTIHRHEWNGIPSLSMLSLVKLNSRSFVSIIFAFAFYRNTNCMCKNITG